MTVAESWRDSHLRTIIPESKALSKELVKFAHPPRILLVEDENPIRDIIVPILASAEFDCLEAETGRSAIDLLSSGDADQP